VAFVEGYELCKVLICMLFMMKMTVFQDVVLCSLVEIDGVLEVRTASIIRIMSKLCAKKWV
jgi:hypothetical protein